MTDSITFDAPDLPDFPDATVLVSALKPEGLKVRYLRQDGMEVGNRISLYLGGEIPAEGDITTDPEQYVLMRKALFEKNVGRAFDLYYRVWNGTDMVGISRDLHILIRP